MRLGLGLQVTRLGGGGGEPETALNTAPASVTRAVFTEHMIFNGSDQLTGFTTDLFGNSANSVVVGTPAKSSDGGYLMTEATANSNYVYTTLAEVNAAAPTGAHVAICYKRRALSDTEGVFVGSSVGTSFVGAAADNNFGASFAGNGSLTAYRGRDTFGTERDYAAASANQNTIHDNFYRYSGLPSIRALCFEDLRMTLNSGRCYWGRYATTDTTYHTEMAVLGWAVCTNQADIEAMNDWLIRWAPTA